MMSASESVSDAVAHSPRNGVAQGAPLENVLVRDAVRSCGHHAQMSNFGGMSLLGEEGVMRSQIIGRS